MWVEDFCLNFKTFALKPFLIRELRIGQILEDIIKFPSKHVGCHRNALLFNAIPISFLSFV